MKKFIFTSVLVLSLVLTTFISMGIEKNHIERKGKSVLSELWKEYESAREADRPQRMAKILEDITEVAKRQRLAWDYFRACREYVEAGSMRNWKLRDSLEASFRKDVEAYDEPLLSLLLMLDDARVPADSALGYVNRNAERMKKSRNADVYAGRYVFPESSGLYSIMLPLVETDYEYALWEILSKSGPSYGSIAGDVLGQLLELMGDDYPKHGFAKWMFAQKHVPEAEGQRHERMKMLASEYEGRAFSLLPLQCAMKYDFLLLDSRGARVDEYEAFRDSLSMCERLRNGFHGGIEGDIARACKGFEVMLDALVRKGAVVSVKGGEAEIMLRNLDGIRLRIMRDGNKAYDTRLENPVRSFYTFDTVRMDMPPLDDGQYVLECLDGGTALGECSYEKYSLSLATRTSVEDTGVYVADYQSGKPLAMVDLMMFKGDRTVAEATGFPINGFTSLPEAFSSRLSSDARRSGYYIQARSRTQDGRLVMSPKVYVYPESFMNNGQTSSVRALVMTDRSAFNPGETVRFKAVVYGTDGEGAMSVAPENTAMMMKLIDPQGKVLDQKNLSLNGFGSCSGEFSLSGAERNGVFRLEAHVDGRVAGVKSVRVDEFTLPTFDLVFDESDSLTLPGDTVVVSGRIFSFSGHSLSSAVIQAQIYKDGVLVRENRLMPVQDGRFSLSFVADCGMEAFHAGYEIKIRITDATGETLEFSHYEQVSRNVILDVNLKNPADGSVRWPENKGHHARTQVLTDDKALIDMNVRRHDGRPAVIDICYELRHGDEVVMKGAASSGDAVEVDFSALSSGLYDFVAKTVVKDGYGREQTVVQELGIMKVREGDTALEAQAGHVICVLDDNEPSVMFGSGNGPIWAVFEVFSDDGRRMDWEIVHLEGTSAAEGSVTTRKYSYPGSGALRLNIFYFHDGNRCFWSHAWQRTEPDRSVPLEITRFRDESLPSEECTIGVRTSPHAEVLAAVFDVSSEKIMPNVWELVRRRPRAVPDIRVRSVCGRDSNGYMAVMGDAHGFSDYEFMALSGMYEDRPVNDMVVGYGGRKGLAGTFKALAVNRSGMAEAAVQAMDMLSVEEESVEMEVVADAAVPVPDLSVREDFSTTLTFEPFLYPDAEGNLELNFRTSDKLSSFVISFFAHDRQMNNSVLRRDMLVTLPVKVSVVPPQYLYQGDKYILKASVSNNSGHAIQGVLLMNIYEGSDYVNMEPSAVMQLPLTLGAGSVSDAEFEIDVPDADTLGFKAAFAGGYEPVGTAVCDVMIQDAVFVDVPVLPARQILTEAHSGVLLPGMSEKEMIRSLRGRFVNVASTGAEYSSVNIMDLLRQALPLVAEPEGKDVISQSEVMYMNLLGGALRASDPSAGGPSYREYAQAAMTAIGKILACTNTDGGIGWFEGMTSSPVVTAVVLERYAGLRDRGVLSLVSDHMGEDALDDFDEAVAAAVKYLDAAYFAPEGRPQWYGGLSQLQYMSVRSMYAGILFDAAAARKSAGSGRWKDFTKAARELLVPRKGMGWTDGAILAKARVLRVISALNESDAGSELASAWGLRSSARMDRSYDKELSSLLEYAVSHPSGGVYYPNAVLPWRGLLESEAYAHAYIADLMKDLSASEQSGSSRAARMNEIADGIRIWLMLQKETQQWEDDPGFADALASVYDASPQARNVKVIVLKKRYEKPFEDINAAGNGMKIAVGYYKEMPAKDRFSQPQRILLGDGDTLETGDKVIAVYSLWSEESRSFVRLSVPRSAIFRPVDQLSGWSGGWFRSWTSGSCSISPYCYRDVKADRTLYWIDVFPEEETTMEEVLFVTQKGCFTTPAAEIECLYAPHYRANDAGGRKFYTKL